MVLPEESFTGETACHMHDCQNRRCCIVDFCNAVFLFLQCSIFYNLYSEELTKLRVWDRLFEGFYALFFIVVLPE